MKYSYETYGDRVAKVYDDIYVDVDPYAIDRLAELAGNGNALELGIGTGRIAVPLLDRGVKLSGIDVSSAMLDQLRAKPGSEKLHLTVGSFVDFDHQSRFDLIYVVFNTFFMLTSQDDQISCFRSVASNLSDKGLFLIEAFVPDLSRFQGGQVNWATRVTEDFVQLDVGQHNPVEQTVTSQKVVLTEGNVRLYPALMRYAWPSELDLMAQLAGLRLRERWNNWQRTPFDSTSGKHISIYEHAS